MTSRPPHSAPSPDREKLAVHRGLATWGERLVPLADFRSAAAAGRGLTDAERVAAVSALLQPVTDATPVEGPYQRIAVFGGIYNNRFALAALLEDAARRGALRLREAVARGGGGLAERAERHEPLAPGGEAAVRGECRWFMRHDQVLQLTP